MGIKGRKKRERERQSKETEANSNVPVEGIIDECNVGVGGNDYPLNLFQGGPFQLPSELSQKTKMSNTERMRMEEEEHLTSMREEHENRKNGGNKNKKISKKKMTQEQLQLEHDKEEVLKDQLRQERKQIRQQSLLERAMNGESTAGIASDVFHNDEFSLNDGLATSIDDLVGHGSNSKKRQRMHFGVGMKVSNSLLNLQEDMVESLRVEGFLRLTRIQERTIPLALEGYDILGQAKTGSGKTLAFVIPMLNHCVRVLKVDIPGAVKKFPLLGLILAPTKELAVQICSVIKNITQHFNSKTLVVRSFLITGGTKVTEERKTLLGGVNIVVGTPGRVLDHIKHCKGWSIETLRYLVLDEADRMLADGFQRDLDAIVRAMPKSRQTFLFSATNSKSVKELARLSLSHTPVTVDTKGEAPVFVDPACKGVPPVYVIGEDDEDDEEEETEELRKLPRKEEEHALFTDIGFGDERNGGDVQEDDENEEENVDGKSRNNKKIAKKDIEDIPSSLRQFCHICKVEDRLRALYVFIKKVAKTTKTMVFCSTVASTIFHCQMLGSVGFHEDVLMLHGHMKHRQRVQTFEAFNSWNTGVLFCTDVAARGLDIPLVEWIVQYDPPLDPTEYIHRIGRTARAGTVGNAVVFLTEDEAAFVKYLCRFGITMERLPMPAKLPDIQLKLENVLQLDPVVAKSAINAYRAHVGAYQSHILNQIFNIHILDLDALAAAFCLTSAPHVSLPKNTTDDKKKEYVKGKLNALNKRKQESIKAYHEFKTKQQWTEDGRFIGVRKPNMT